MVTVTSLCDEGLGRPQGESRGDNGDGGRARHRGFSTDGSEPSVQPARGQLDCGAGYEFWLARQALARNPAIRLYGLQWTAPAWVRDGHGGLWSRADVGYVVGWLRCARQNGLAISYVGGWNEHFQGTPLQRAWFVSTAAQQITVHVTGGLPARVVHVWSTSLRGAGQFIRRGDIIPDRGAFDALLRPGYVYTFTTTTGQSRAGGHLLAVPVAGPMPVRYTATPDGAGLADMLAPIDGSFGYVHGVLTQTAAGEPVEWQYPGRSPAPYAIIGQNAWRDYTVSARVILPASGTGSQGAALIARFEGFRGSAVSQFRGYELRVRGNGAWQIVANGPAAVLLASGSVAGARAYALSLTIRGTTITAQINGVLVATVTNRMYRYGPAGLASLGYYPVRYPASPSAIARGTGPHRLAGWRRSPQNG